MTHPSSLRGLLSAVGAVARVWAPIVAVLAFSACTQSLEGKPCPCTAEYVCCEGFCRAEGTCALDDAGDREPPRSLPSGASESMSDFVQLHDVHDMVHDGARDLLYVTGVRAEGEPWRIHRYDLVNHRLLEPLAGEGELWGLALSADHRWLAAADASSDGVLVADLESGAVERVAFEREAQEGPAYASLFVDETHFALTTARTDPPAADDLTVPLRIFDVNTHTGETARDDHGDAVRVSPGSLPALDATKRALVLAQSDAAIGRLVTYDLDSHALTTTWTNLNMGDLSVRRDGGLLALASYAGLVVQDAAGTRRPLEPREEFDWVAGAVFSPRGDILYAANGSTAWTIAAYHTGTERTVHVVERDATQLSNYTTRTFGLGRLRVDESGSLLFAHVKFGVGIYRVGGEGEEPDDTVLTPPVQDDPGVEELPAHAAYARVVPVTGARDVVYDQKRRVVYASSSHGGLYGSVLAWSVDEGGPARPLPLDGRYAALAISPDQNTLAIADENGFLDHLRVELVDLQTGHVHPLELARTSPGAIEFSAYDLTFLDDDTLLLSARALEGATGVVPLRLIDLRTGAAQVVHEVAPDALLSRSADGTQVAVSWSSYEPCGIDRYVPALGADEAYQEGPDEVRPFGVALSRDGTQVAIPARPGVLVFDAAGTLAGTLGPLEDPLELAYESRPFSAVYSPVHDLLYVAWTAAGPSDTPPSVTVYDTRTLMQQAVVEPATGVYAHLNAGPFASGRMHISGDANHLFVIGTWGIGMYDLRDGLPQ